MTTVKYCRLEHHNVVLSDLNKDCACITCDKSILDCTDGCKEYDKRFNLPLEPWEDTRISHDKASREIRRCLDCMKYVKCELYDCAVVWSDDSHYCPCSNINCNPKKHSSLGVCGQGCEIHRSMFRKVSFGLPERCVKCRERKER